MIQAQVAKEAKSALQPFSYDEKIDPNDVLIKITHCGICHSDVHLVDGDWGEVFPCIPGHEIVGIVESIGSKVTLVKPGDKVGVGWQCNSCNDCEYCNDKEEVFCAENQATCMNHFGGFAEKVVVNERFTIPIPAEMDSAKTAPLLCGGITVYNPLSKYAKKGSSVAIIGIGGLGHLGVQFAAAMGCDVTAISTSKDKETAAIAFGAKHFLTTAPEPNSYDVILNTAHFSPDMKVFMASLKPKGTFVQLGVTPEDFVFDSGSVIGGNKIFTGNGYGTPEAIKEMILFAHTHGVEAKVEVVPMSDANAALDKTRKNQARFRMVLEN
jgi:uncharacterized zinc-type alcohol dehydrogenase-like protein